MRIGRDEAAHAFAALAADPGGAGGFAFLAPDMPLAEVDGLARALFGPDPGREGLAACDGGRPPDAGVLLARWGAAS